MGESRGETISFLGAGSSITWAGRESWGDVGIGRCAMGKSRGEIISFLGVGSSIA